MSLLEAGKYRGKLDDIYMYVRFCGRRNFWILINNGYLSKLTREAFTKKLEKYYSNLDNYANLYFYALCEQHLLNNVSLHILVLLVYMSRRALAYVLGLSGRTR